MNLEKGNNLTAIICLTEKGAELALRLGELLGTEVSGQWSVVGETVYIPKRLEGSVVGRQSSVVGTGAPIKYFEDWQGAFAEVFSKYPKIICIMATGIVIRSLVPLIKSKYNDPAVIVLDEKGDFVISLLSGHVGGANDLARNVAAKLGGQDVITTATDVRGKPAVDILAAELDGLVVPIEKVKVFNRLLVEGEKVYLSSPFPIVSSIKEGFVWQEWSEYSEPAVLISPYIPKDTNHIIQILPRNLVVGIGCRKRVDLEVVVGALKEVFKNFRLDERCIKSLATIDFKGEEEALRLLSKEMKISLKTVSKDEIKTLEGTFEPSGWVKKQIGVDGVCEPAAKIVANKGYTIVPKQKAGPVTISVAVEKSWWLDSDREIKIF